jgi:hypothetical protein
MKKHSRIIFVMAACLAGLMGQLTAFGANTNSAWNVSAVSKISAGKIKDSETNSATAVFLSDGTFNLTIQGAANTIGGTYTNTASSLTITLSTNGVAAVASNTFDAATAVAPGGITISITKVGKPSRIQLKNGVPQKGTDRISGKGSEEVRDRTVSRSFSVTDTLIDWTLSSGTNFPGRPVR